MRVEFLGYPVDNLDKHEFINYVQNSILSGSKNVIAVQNANKMYLSNKYTKMKDYFKISDIILPENAINIGMHILGSSLVERNMGGVNMMAELLLLCNKYSYSVYFLGSTKYELMCLIDAVRLKYSNVKILGYHDGYFTGSEEQNIIDEIKENRPNILFIGLGSPKQEYFILEYLKILPVNIIMGVGGSFKVIGGLDKPAPRWTKYGFEWLYRSIQEPKKFKRYITVNTFFIKELVSKGLMKI